MKRIITIGRQYGSGGREIGEKLAEKLKIKCYDKLLIVEASKQSGISENLFYENDERQTGSIIYSLFMGGYVNMESSLVYPQLPINNRVFLAQFDTIKNIAEKESCIFVGRCADYVLEGNEGLVKIFITADEDSKIQRVCKRNNIDEKKAADLIKKTDKDRAHHYKYYTLRNWGDLNNYDIVINSSKFGIDKTVDVLYDYILKI